MNNNQLYQRLHFDAKKLEGTLYFETSSPNHSPSINSGRESKNRANLVIYSIYNWRYIDLLSLHNLLVSIGLSLASSLDNEGDLLSGAVSFIEKVAKDCVIRAKEMMMNVNEQYRSVVPHVLSLQGSIFTMAMAYYQSVGCPCRGYHELFFNRILYILYRVIRRTTAKLENNAKVLFKSFYFTITPVNDDWYILNETTILSQKRVRRSPSQSLVKTEGMLMMRTTWK